MRVLLEVGLVAGLEVLLEARLVVRLEVLLGGLLEILLEVVLEVVLEIGLGVGLGGGLMGGLLLRCVVVPQPHEGGGSRWWVHAIVEPSLCTAGTLRRSFVAWSFRFGTIRAGFDF